jgi:hypothetical protein
MSKRWQVLRTEAEVITAMAAGLNVDFGSLGAGRMGIRGDMTEERVRQIWSFGHEFRVETDDALTGETPAGEQ